MLGCSGWIRSSTFFWASVAAYEGSYFLTEMAVEGYPHLQENIQLLSNVIDCSNLGLGFSDKVIFLLLELLSPFVESMDIWIRKIRGMERSETVVTSGVRRVQSSTC